MELKTIDSMNCPYCEAEGAITPLKAQYTRPGWLVGYCRRCDYVWSAVKLKALELESGKEE
jgi:hypothetical protein